MVVERALLVDTPDEGLNLSTSPEMLLGGVSRLPTLAIVAEACDGWEALTLWKEEYLCIGGGGSSKFPN